MPDGAPSGQRPITGYRMFGVPCSKCALPMSVMWVFSDHLEVWHDGTKARCYMAYQPPPSPPEPLRVPEKKPDARKQSRRYPTCSQCGVRFMKPINGGESGGEKSLCKSCRSQTELFTYDEIKGVASGVPLEQRRT